MTEPVKQAIQTVLENRDIPEEKMYQAISSIMDGDVDEVNIASLLTGLRMKGESVSEIVGAARAMRDHATRIPTTQTGLLDTCGTGGDSLHTFNISTASSLVIASAGVPIAKHGNRSVSSSSGAADVLEELGVNIEISPESVSECIQKIGIGFCYARLLHSAMKHSAPVRAKLGFRTLVNLLGPLTNPAGAEYQLMGTISISVAEKLANALNQLGLKKGFVVCGAGELDEISLWGETTVFQIEEGKVEKLVWNAETFGLPECDVKKLQVKNAKESAGIIKGIFSGEKGPCRDMVVANSAAGLLLTSKADSVRDAVALVRDILDSGKAAERMNELTQLTQSMKS